MKKPLALEELSETQYDALLFGANKGTAPSLGWDSFHALKMRGSKPGYPDRTFWRERVAFAELKVGKNKPSDEQIRILDGLARAGAETYAWWNTQADLGEIGEILGRRWVYCPPSKGTPGLMNARGDFWRPCSLWIAGSGRADASGGCTPPPVQR